MKSLVLYSRVSCTSIITMHLDASTHISQNHFFHPLQCDIINENEQNYIVDELYKKKATSTFENYKRISLQGRDNLLTTHDSGRKGIDEPFSIVFISLVGLLSYTSSAPAC